MNIYQRIILILGALFFIIVIWTAPTVQYTVNGMVLVGGTGRNLANVLDYITALTRGAGVVGATFLLFFAFKGIGKKEQEGKKED